MHTIMDTKAFASFYYGVEEPRKSQVNTITQMCRDRKFKCARQIGKKWFIDCTLEWPEMFPGEERKQEPQAVEVRQPLITADMKLGDALAVLLDALAGNEIANAS